MSDDELAVVDWAWVFQREKKRKMKRREVQRQWIKKDEKLSHPPLSSLCLNRVFNSISDIEQYEVAMKLYHKQQQKTLSKLCGSPFVLVVLDSLDTCLLKIITVSMIFKNKVRIITYLNVAGRLTSKVKTKEIWDKLKMFKLGEKNQQLLCKSCVLWIRLFCTLSLFVVTWSVDNDRPPQLPINRPHRASNYTV